ncbi:MAG: argininosuccinate lyase [Clostridiales bacterium]|nr:argininosuccinate lyase [Clostridiales bacterium]
MKLWGGRFTESQSKAFDHFHSSISFDKRLYKQDIAGSLAHAEMLSRQGIISENDFKLISDGLLGLLEDAENGKIEFDEAAEDIHMNLEKLLTERIGEAGKRLHTGRSRNDQVATDTRLYVKEEAAALKNDLLHLITVLTDLAEKHTGTIMPGYTHLQRAQPVTLAHHLLAYAEMHKRDIDRLNDAYRRADVMPLGAGALAGTTYPIDREFTAKKLGFSKICANSLDAVSDRDFALDLLYALSVIMLHISRFCEEIILWSSREFGFVELSDAYSTGSSIMPQKKNPDAAELARGKTGRVFGDLLALLTVMKGLPLAYNKDMQEDKEPLFDAADTARAVLPVFTDMLATARFNEGKMRDAAGGGFTNATDAADWLVGRGVPFRDAHEVIGRLVLYCSARGKSLDELTLEEYREVSPLFDESVYDAISLENCVNRRDIPGAPARERTLALIAENRRFLAGDN